MTEVDVQSVAFQIKLTDAPHSTIKELGDILKRDGALAPSTLALRFTYRDGTWAASADVSGAKLKKNGEPGQVYMEVGCYYQDNLPTWLREIIDRYRPEGAL